MYFQQTQDDPVWMLRAELWDVFTVHTIAEDEQDASVTFVGRLQQDADHVFRVLKQRFSRYGYTPLLRRLHGQDAIIAVPGAIRPYRGSRLVLPILLLLATMATTTIMGSLLVGANPLRDPQELWWGAAFAFGLLSILGVHELGHYLLARYHGVAVTLPYFIPVPFGLGTFGAFIQLKSPVENRRALFDVGVAGPIAGALVAIPLFIIGLTRSPLVVAPGHGGLGRSLLVDALIQLIRPHPPGYAVMLHPLALAAWFGLLITGFNLLPAGQLDGGHIAYAILGERARWITAITLLILIAMGSLYWSGWYIWALFVALTGLTHPAPLNDITPLNGKRHLGALLALGLFALTFSAAPF